MRLKLVWMGWLCSCGLAAHAQAIPCSPEIVAGTYGGLVANQYSTFNQNNQVMKGATQQAPGLNVMILDPSGDFRSIEFREDPRNLTVIPQRDQEFITTPNRVVWQTQGTYWIGSDCIGHARTKRLVDRYTGVLTVPTVPVLYDFVVVQGGLGIVFFATTPSESFSGSLTRY